jgi:hypothetical protein
MWWSTYCASDVMQAQRAAAHSTLPPDMQAGVRLATLALAIGGVIVFLWGSLLLPRLNHRFGPRVVFHCCTSLQVALTLFMTLTDWGLTPFGAVTLYSLMGIVYPTLHSNPFVVAAKYYSPDYDAVVAALTQRRRSLLAPLTASLRLHSQMRAHRSDKLAGERAALLGAGHADSDASDADSDAAALAPSSAAGGVTTAKQYLSALRSLAQAKRAAPAAAPMSVTPTSALRRAAAVAIATGRRGAFSTEDLPTSRTAAAAAAAGGSSARARTLSPASGFAPALASVPLPLVTMADGSELTAPNVARVSGIRSQPHSPALSAAGSIAATAVPTHAHEHAHEHAPVPASEMEETASAGEIAAADIAALTAELAATSAVAATTAATAAAGSDALGAPASAPAAANAAAAAAAVPGSAAKRRLAPILHSGATPACPGPGGLVAAAAVADDAGAASDSESSAPAPLPLLASSLVRSWSDDPVHLSALALATAPAPLPAAPAAAADADAALYGPPSAAGSALTEPQSMAAAAPAGLGFDADATMNESPLLAAVGPLSLPDGAAAADSAQGQSGATAAVHGASVLPDTASAFSLGDSVSGGAPGAGVGAGGSMSADECDGDAGSSARDRARLKRRELQARVRDTVEIAVRSRTLAQEARLEELAQLEQAGTDEECYGSVAAVMTVTMTAGQCLMGLTAGMLIHLLGSIRRVFTLGALLLTVVHVCLLTVEYREWRRDENIANELARRRRQRSKLEKQARAVQKAARALTRSAVRDAKKQNQTIKSEFRHAHAQAHAQAGAPSVSAGGAQ